MTAASTAKKGSISKAISSVFSPDTDAATNNTKPIGGVASPTVKFTHMITAKCNGSMPREINIGASTGPKIKMAGPASKNMPMANRNKLIINSSNNTLSVMPVISEARVSAMPDTVMIQAKVTAEPTNNKMVPDCTAELTNIVGNLLNFKVLVTNRVIISA